MNSILSSKTRFGGLLSVLTGLAYVAAAVSAAMLPAELSANPNITPHEFWTVLTRNSNAHMAMHWAFVAVGLFGIGTVLPVRGLTKNAAAGAVQYCSALAFLGFAVNARSHLMELAFDRKVLVGYATADHPFQQAVHVTAALALDIPDGVLTLGGIGLWMSVLSVASLRASRTSWPIAISGIGATAFFFAGIAGYVVMNQWLITASFVGGNLVFAPLWHIAVGARLLRTPICTRSLTRHDQCDDVSEPAQRMPGSFGNV